MDDELTRAQRYRALAEEMESLARTEPDETRKAELQGLAQQYRKLADKLIDRH